MSRFIEYLYIHKSFPHKTTYKIHETRKSLVLFNLLLRSRKH